MGHFLVSKGSSIPDQASESEKMTQVCDAKKYGGHREISCVLGQQECKKKQLCFLPINFFVREEFYSVIKGREMLKRHGLDEFWDIYTFDGEIELGLYVLSL